MTEMKNDTAPKPMTTDLLMAYLYNVIDHHPVDEQFVMIGDEDLIVSMNLKNRKVTFLSDRMLKDGEVAKAPVTTNMLMKYLELATGGIFHAVLNEPVMIGMDELVHAEVIDNRVILQTAHDYLAAQ
ncbi:gp073 [Rhodococcus phage ReqiPepy6]|uniref:Gp073 n=1 Tax=Rhodococcus phage ReqiPepy6 TaxID=691965 RepID=D4P7I4_9CAUD|nr:gp073 [Rhodococcus phage ReqiPepy6]ADD80964.1 gp073 [Rhodococcus phage ReqiPepy6]